MRKVEKCSSAGTKDDSSTNAHDSQVSQPIAKPRVGRSLSNDAKCIFIGVSLMVLLSILFMFGVNYYPAHKMIVSDEQGNKVDSLEIDGYNSVYDLAREYRVTFYEKNGVQPETYYKSKLWYERVR